MAAGARVPAAAGEFIVMQKSVKPGLHVLVLTWDLSGNAPAVFQELRSYIASESWERYRRVEGLIQKVWFSNEATGVFGAFYLWETPEALEREVASMHRVERMTGVKPSAQRFEMEAMQEGSHQAENLLKLGRAWPT